MNILKRFLSWLDTPDLENVQDAEYTVIVNSDPKIPRITAIPVWIKRGITKEKGDSV